MTMIMSLMPDYTLWPNCCGSCCTNENFILETLQQHLNTLSIWATTRNISFNADKCECMKIILVNEHITLTYNYTMNNIKIKVISST